MSLPTAKATQSSILSFFQQKTPKYAPPPARQPAPAPPPEAKESSPPEAKKSAPPKAKESSPPPSPHPQAAIRPVSPADITALRRINSLLLPVAYPDAFYQNVLDPSVSALFSRAITWADDAAAPKVIGGIVCRIEEVAPPALSEDAPYHVLYIQSLVLLSPYRGLGLAAAALDVVLAAAQRDESIDVRHVYAHVWTENEDGLRWYEARGFARAGEPVRGYYFKLRPDSAWVVRRDVAPVRAPAPDAPPQTVPPSATARLANLPDRGGPPKGASGQSFQNLRPEAEWNDLPADMARGSAASSAQSSRSSSSARKKRDRAYPAQAFGS